MKNTTKLLNLLTTFLVVIGTCAASLVCFIVAYTQINGGFSPKCTTDYSVVNDDSTSRSLSDADAANNYNNTESISLTANQTSDEIYEQSAYEYDVNSTSLENDYTVNAEANGTSDSAIYAMPIEQGTSDTGFITDTPTQSANIYNSNGNNFNTYNNPEQQQTDDSYVLNTNPERMKIHYPTCNDVAKIAPENCSTSNLSISELQSQGYTTCGHCFR